MLTGRVDDFQNAKLFGWAFNTDQPDEHLLVKVSFGSQVIASGMANLMRKDLPESGIGKGDHAFEISLPPHIVSLHGLVVVAQSSRHGDAVLAVASNQDRHLDELFQSFSDRYEAALRTLKSEQDMLASVVTALKASPPPAATVEPLPDNLEERLSQIEDRLSANDIFLMRIDEHLKKLTAEVKGRRGSRLPAWLGGRH